jgi:hypothetical protein
MLVKSGMSAMISAEWGPTADWNAARLSNPKWVTTTKAGGRIGREARETLLHRHRFHRGAAPFADQRHVLGQIVVHVEPRAVFVRIKYAEIDHRFSSRMAEAA